MNRKEFRENVKVHGKRAKEKGIVILARLLFGRTMVTILLLLLQIITLVVAFKWFQNYTDWFYHIMVVLSAAFVFCAAAPVITAPAIKLAFTAVSADTGISDAAGIQDAAITAERNIDKILLFIFILLHCYTYA